VYSEFADYLDKIRYDGAFADDLNQACMQPVDPVSCETSENIL